MISIAKKFYEEKGIVPFLLKRKLECFERNPDILGEFVDWINTRTYKEKDCVSVAGYTAKTIAQKSPFLDGEGAFMILIELRENYPKAIDKLSAPIVIK